MAAKQTPHYQLNQWEAEDAVLRSDFNDDNQKIDSAIYSTSQKLQTQITSLLARPYYRTLVYSGDGSTSRDIDLGVNANLAILTGLDESSHNGLALVTTFGVVCWFSWQSNTGFATSCVLSGTSLHLALNGQFNHAGSNYLCIAFP